MTQSGPLQKLRVRACVSASDVQAPIDSCSLKAVNYMDGVSAAFMDMADTVLIVNGVRLPIHRAILAASSKVFAEVFAATMTDKATCKLEVPLTGDKLEDVRTSLKYLYKGCKVSRAGFGSLNIQSLGNAQSLVRFAHKYSMDDWLLGTEDYLMDLALVDASAAAVGPEVNKLFTSTEAIIGWTVLAEECGLARFGACCEFFMVNSRDTMLWQHPAFLSANISRECTMRLLCSLQAYKNCSTSCLKAEDLRRSGLQQLQQLRQS